MPNFPAVTPPLGQNVEATMANGDIFTGYWDGLQWWVGVPDSPNDLPVSNLFVTAWKFEGE